MFRCEHAQVVKIPARTPASKVDDQIPKHSEQGLETKYHITKTPKTRYPTPDTKEEISNQMMRPKVFARTHFHKPRLPLQLEP